MVAHTRGYRSDYILDRIIIRHDEKPSKDVIVRLKQMGMKWSPRNQGWQRKITNNALWVLSQSEYKEIK